jgi:hypothetical protein
MLGVATVLGSAQDSVRPAHRVLRSHGQGAHDALCCRTKRTHGGLCGVAGGKPTMIEPGEGLHRKLH